MPPPHGTRAVPGRGPCAPAMTAPDPDPGTAGRTPAAVTTYRAFLAAGNDQDLEAAAALVDPAR